MSVKRVLSVGQCGYDHGRISARLKEWFGVEVVAVSDEVEATRRIGGETFALVLVNRVFDMSGESGIDYIRRHKKSSSVPVMLVSNFEDAQKEAVEAGALPGFGKATLGTEAAKKCMEGVLT